MYHVCLVCMCMCECINIMFVLRKYCAMLKASIVALFIMLSTQHEIVNLISPVTIFVSTRPLVNCTLVTSFVDVCHVFIQPNFSIICSYIVVIKNTPLNDDVVFTQIPDFSVIIVLQIFSVRTAFTLGAPVQSNTESLIYGYSGTSNKGHSE